MTIRFWFVFVLGLTSCRGTADGGNGGEAKLSTPTPSSTAAPSSPGFATRKISVGSREVVVEVADTDARRERGLMFRQSLGENDGMLFVFDDEAIRRFWMKNTRIPLSIAFINARREIIDIQDMNPAAAEDVSPPFYTSRGPAQYALEMNLGWFVRHNVRVGDSLKDL